MPVREEEIGEDEFLIPAPSANVSTPSPGPEPSSAAPVQPTEPQPVTDDGVESEEASSEPLPEFDPRYRQAFEGLLYVGKLTDSFNWLGHGFTIRTLTMDDVLEIGLLHAPYVGTLADVKAYQALVVAACVTKVDDRPLVIPITDEDSDSKLANNFRYVLRHWYPPTLDAIYERFLLLEQKATQVIDAMGKASG